MLSSNINTIADLSNTGINAALLNISIKNYDVSKEILDVNKKLLDISDNDSLLKVLIEISENQKHIIELLENMN